jgi:hypothetical protein
MATINLGAIKFNWKGAYNNSTAYAVDDVVSSGGNSYVCIQASQGNAVGNATAYWNIMSSAGTNGTNGTDLTSTLTTQGDIVYRDGSGLARLGYGTAGQVLQTGGSGANPSWGTVSSDYVKLISTTISSATSQVNFADFHSSAYAGYKVFISNLKKTGTSDRTWRLRFKYGSTVVSNSTYRGCYDGMNYHSDNSSDYQKGGFWNADYAEISNWNTPDTRTSDYAINIEMFIPEFKTDTLKHFHWQRSGQHASGTYMNHSEGFGYNHDSSLMTSDMTASGSGFIIYPVGDQIASGQFTLYGLKK